MEKEEIQVYGIRSLFSANVVELVLWFRLHWRKLKLHWRLKKAK